MLASTIYAHFCLTLGGEHLGLCAPACVHAETEKSVLYDEGND